VHFNAGNGGVIQQLKKVGEVITCSPVKKPKESRASRQEPLNAIAPVPRASQKAKGKRKANQASLY
jgi:hypothetical protein